jgi:hypothetical protein
MEFNERLIGVRYRLALEQEAVWPVNFLHCLCIDLHAACRHQVS